MIFATRADGVRAALRRSALALALAALALSMLARVPAAAGGPPTRLSIDNVRVTGAGLHELVVRVQDAQGAPVEGLESDLIVTLDDHGVGEARTAFAGSSGPRTLVVVVDAALLRGEGAAVVDGVLRAAARELSSEDRILVVLAGDRPVAKEWSAREMSQAGDRLASVAVAGGPRIFDALKLGAEKAAAKRRLSSGAILAVTRGDDRGSRARAADVLAAALRGGVTSLGLVEVSGGEGEGAQALERLVPLTGGALWRVQPGAPLPPTLGPEVRALLDRYRVTFRDTRWKRDGESHRLEAHVGRGGRVGDAGTEVVGELSYRASAVYAAAWWPTLVLGLVLVLLLAGGVMVLMSRQKKQQCLLVTQGGDDDGQWYEVFELPLRIGSARENDVILVQQGISRSHCMLQREDDGIVLMDTNSEYGTFVNGERVSRHVLEEDDVIRLGMEVALAYEGR